MQTSVTAAQLITGSVSVSLGTGSHQMNCIIFTLVKFSWSCSLSSCLFPLFPFSPCSSSYLLPLFLLLLPSPLVPLLLPSPLVPPPPPAFSPCLISQDASNVRRSFTRLDTNVLKIVLCRCVLCLGEGESGMNKMN